MGNRRWAGEGEKLPSQELAAFTSVPLQKGTRDVFLGASDSPWQRGIQASDSCKTDTCFRFWNVISWQILLILASKALKIVGSSFIQSSSWRYCVFPAFHILWGKKDLPAVWPRNSVFDDTGEISFLTSLCVCVRPIAATPVTLFSWVVWPLQKAFLLA